MGEDCHAFMLGELLLHQLANGFVFIGQDAPRNLRKVYFGTEGGHKLGDLYRLAAAANHI